MRPMDSAQVYPREESEVETLGHHVVVFVDGKRVSLTREQEALIRSWASGPV